MQIGEFAKICNTKISVLRHYDKEGLLQPDYIDKFTGYRYYSKEQITDFLKISMLKNAGFSLAEIKSVIAEHKNTDAIMQLFEKKKCDLMETLQNLDEAKKRLLGVEQIMKLTIIESGTGLKCRGEKAAAGSVASACGQMDKALLAEGYQRVSGFCVNEAEIDCDVVRLTDSEAVLQENIDLPFENDDTIIGKWETIGEFAVKEDFYLGRSFADGSPDVKTVYFLPEGERYWCFGWTKGKLLTDDGVSTAVNDYTTETYNAQRYMFVDFKSYYYRHGGTPTVLVLKQADNRAYTAAGIARKDDIDLPFVPDERVLGRWKAVDFCRKKEDFTPGCSAHDRWYFSGVEFKPDGELVSWYDFGRDVISGRDMQEWTKGFVLRKWNHCACAYEIRDIGGTEYLIMEWKSGDYRWGGLDTDFYVFERE